MLPVQLNRLIALAAFLGAGLVLSSPAAATGQKAPNPENAGQNVERLLAAYKLIDIGYADKNPQALILAADMLARLDGTPTRDKLKVGNSMVETGKAATADLPEQLLKDALDMDVPKDERPAIAALVKSVKAKLGTRDLDQPVYAVVELPAGAKAEWVRKPRAKSITRVLVKGDGAVGVEVSAFQQGQELASDVAPAGGPAFVRFYTIEDRDVTIVVKNVSSKKSRFTISTN
jgi:hypothetical protein